MGPCFQYVLAFNVQSAMEDALGDKASRCLPRFGIAFATCCLGFAVGLGYTLQVSVDRHVEPLECSVWKSSWGHQGVVV